MATTSSEDLSKFHHNYMPYFASYLESCGVDLRAVIGFVCALKMAEKLIRLSLRGNLPDFVQRALTLDFIGGSKRVSQSCCRLSAVRLIIGKNIILLIPDPV